jgi:RNA-binding protein NOB1
MAGNLFNLAVIQFAKKTGDYSVLSHADLSVLALTYDLHIQAKAEAEKINPGQVRSYFFR